MEDRSRESSNDDSEVTMNAEMAGIDMQSSQDADSRHYQNNSDAATPPIKSMKQYKPPPSIQMIPNESENDLIHNQKNGHSFNIKMDLETKIEEIEPMSSRSDVDNSQRGLISSHSKQISKQFSDKRATSAGIDI